MGFTFQSKAIDGKQGLIHRFGSNNCSRWKEILYFIDTAFQFCFGRINICTPIKKYIHNTTSPACTAFYGCYTLYPFNCTFQWLSHGNHHPVDWLLTCIGNDCYTGKGYFGKQVSLHLPITIGSCK